MKERTEKQKTVKSAGVIYNVRGYNKVGGSSTNKSVAAFDLKEEKEMKKSRKEFVIQSRGFVLKSGVLDNKDRNVEKKAQFSGAQLENSVYFCSVYYGL